MRWDCCWCKFQLIYRFPLMVVNDNIIYFASKTDQAMKNVLCISWQIRPLLCTVHILWWQSVRIKINASTYTIIQTPLPSILPLSTEQCGLFTWSIIILQGRVGQRGETGRQSRILFISQIVLPLLPLLPLLQSSEDKYHTNICRAWLWWWDQNWNLNTDCEAGSELSQSWPVI